MVGLDDLSDHPSLTDSVVFSIRPREADGTFPQTAAPKTSWGTKPRGDYIAAQHYGTLKPRNLAHLAFAFPDLQHTHSPDTTDVFTPPCVHFAR